MSALPDPVSDQLERSLCVLEDAIASPHLYRGSVPTKPYPRLSLVVVIEYPDTRRRAALVQGVILPHSISKALEVSPLVPSWPFWARRARFENDAPFLEPVRYVANEDPAFPVPDDAPEFIAILAAQLAEERKPT